MGGEAGRPQVPTLTRTLALQFVSTPGHSGQNPGTRAPLDPRRTLGPEHPMAALRRSRRPSCRVPGTPHRASGGPLPTRHPEGLAAPSISRPMVTPSGGRKDYRDLPSI